MNEIIVDVSRRIYEPNEGASVVVSPCSDGLLVLLRTNEDKASIDWFGKFEASFSPEVARAVAASLIACAAEIEQSAK